MKQWSTCNRRFQSRIQPDSEERKRRWSNPSIADLQQRRRRRDDVPRGLPELSDINVGGLSFELHPCQSDIDLVDQPVVNVHVQVSQFQQHHHDNDHPEETVVEKPAAEGAARVAADDGGDRSGHDSSNECGRTSRSTPQKHRGELLSLPQRSGHGAVRDQQVWLQGDAELD